MSPADLAGAATGRRRPDLPLSRRTRRGRWARWSATSRWRERPGRPAARPSRRCAPTRRRRSSPKRSRRRARVARCRALPALLDCYGIAMPAAIVGRRPGGRGPGRGGDRRARRAEGARTADPAQDRARRGSDRARRRRGGRAGGRERWMRRWRSAGSSATSFLVQRMVEGGVELLVGIATDPVFGPVVACGAGGTAVELLGDVSVRVCPLGGGDGDEMLGSLAICPDARRLPRPGAGRPRRLEELIAAGRRPRRGPPGDRRARPQPGHRRPPTAPSPSTPGSGSRAPRRRGRGPHLGLSRQPGSGVDQAVLERVAGQLGPAVEAELLLDVGAVGLHRADAERELLGDLAVGVAERHQPQHLGLAR